jgi:CDP-paratose 2-epimerase
MRYEYVDKNREGDHICYISDLSKMRAHYPEWDIRVPLNQIYEEIVEGWQQRATK